MKSSSLKLALIILVISVCCSVVYFKSSIGQTKSKSIQQDPRVTLISDYKKWTLVNPKPVMMEKTVAAMCAAPMLNKSPHKDKYISVYVNNIGKSAMMDQLKPQFPVGTVIVKEKLDQEDSKTPELLTVMVKREKGFNKELDDWEFLVFDGTAAQAQNIEAESCQRCHEAYTNTNFIVRNYLPDDVKKKLK